MSHVGKERWWALIALAISSVAIGLDVTVLNLALPTLAVKLHAASGDLQWFVDAYTLVFAAVILPAGLAGDRYGRKRWLLGGLVLFGLASACCAFSGSVATLIAARGALGLAAAVVTALSVSVLPVMFTAEERPTALAILFGAAMLAYPIGPLLGGWLLSNYWWGWVFLINVPIVLLALYAVARFLPESRSPRRPRLDLPGVIVSSLGLAALTYGVIEAGQRGWGDARALVDMLAGLAVLLAFWAWERRLSAREGGEPLVDLTLFRSRGFSSGTALATLSTLVMFGLLYAMPQYFREVVGTDAMGAGARLLPTIGGLLVGLLMATALQRQRRPDGAAAGPGGDGAAPDPPAPAPARGNAKLAAGLGFAVMSAGVLIGASTSAHTGEGFTAMWFAIVGFGLGFVLPTTMNAALGAISTERSGVGSALIMALRFVGATIGVAVLGTILNDGYRGRLDQARLPAGAARVAGEGVTEGVALAARLRSPALLETVRSAFVHGLDLTLLACAGIGVAALLIALALLPRRAPVTAAGAPLGAPDALLGAVHAPLGAAQPPVEQPAPSGPAHGIVA